MNIKRFNINSFLMIFIALLTVFSFVVFDCGTDPTPAPPTLDEQNFESALEILELASVTLTETDSDTYIKATGNRIVSNQTQTITVVLFVSQQAFDNGLASLTADANQLNIDTNSRARMYTNGLVVFFGDVDLTTVVRTSLTSTNTTVPLTPPPPTPALTNIEITTLPANTVYTVGQRFNPSGLVVTANYTQNHSYIVQQSSLTFTPSLTTILTLAHTQITVGYMGKTAPIIITVQPEETTSHIVRFFNGSTLLYTSSIGLSAPLPLDDYSIADTPEFEFVGWQVDRVVVEPNGVKITSVSALWNSLVAREWNFPIMSIKTDPSNVGYTNNLFAGISRDTWVQGAMVSMSNAENPVFNFDYTTVDVRGRGNSTWGMYYGSKQPYRIRFPNDINTFPSMLDSGYRARNWALIASHSDRTLMRHYTAYNLGRAMGGRFSHHPFTRFIHLYINDEYRGVYMLTDHMDTDGLYYGETAATASGRVNIRGGNMPNSWRDDPYHREYYIEMCRRADGYQGVVADHWFRVPNWARTGSSSFGMPFEFRDDSGLGREAGPLLEAEARDFVRNVHDVIRSRNWNNIQQVIDVPSFVDYYIVQDLFMGNDINFSSVHMTLRGTRSNRKLHMGPLWDFDLSANNSSWGTTDPVNNPNGGHHVAWHHPWFYNLVQHVPQFRALVVARLAEVTTTYLPQAIDRLNSNAANYRKDFDRNFAVWDIIPGTVAAGNPSHNNLPTFDAHINQLSTFLTQRAGWMTANIR